MQILCEYDQMHVTDMIQIKHNKLKIPTGGRLTSWIFTRHGGIEFGGLWREIHLVTGRRIWTQDLRITSPALYH